MSTIDGGTGTTVMDEAPEPGTPVAEESSRKRLLVILGIVGGLLFLLVAIFAWYLFNHKSLSQLPGLNTLYSAPTFRSSIYGVTQPVGVAVSADGQRVYVTQSAGKKTVIEFDRSGHYISTLTPPAKSGPSHVPVYVAINPVDQTVWVTDRLTAAIYVYDANGKYQRTIKQPVGVTGHWQPLAIAFDKDGTLYVSDVSGTAHRVHVIDKSGVLKRTLKGSPDAPMSFPNGIAIDDKGRVIVTDSNNGRLLAFDSTGVVLGSVNRGIGTGDLGLPRGLTIDPDGRIYVVDTTNMIVNVYRLGDNADEGFTYLGTFGTQGLQNGQFQYPGGAASDDRSDVFVVDRENNRVQVFSY